MPQQDMFKGMFPNFGPGGGGGGGAGGGGGGASNQWFPALPGLPQNNLPPVNQPANQPASQPGMVPAAGPGTFNQGAGGVLPTGLRDLGRGFSQIPQTFPAFAGDFMNWLRTTIGQGATPFNLQAQLPSGGATDPGQVSAPLNPIAQQIMQFLQGGGGGGQPGLDTMQQLSETGLPISQLPAWQAMIAAQERNIGQREAGLREQFAFTGNLAGSPFGTAMTDFQSQTALDQNALLAMMETGALESAAGRQAGASQFLAGMGGEFSELLQGLDQDSINRLMQEFIRTRPEYSPLLNLDFGAATTTPGVVSKEFGLGGIGALLQGGGELAGALNEIFGGGQGG